MKRNPKIPAALGKCPVDLAAIKRALAEDAPKGDVTTAATIPTNAVCTARLIAKQKLVLSGIDLFKAVMLAKDKRIKVVRHFKDGQSVPKGARIASISGPAASVIIAERVALNYLGRLCGVATLTRRFTGTISGTGAVILDTRKTTPGFRDLEKYAVRCGGGSNHRRDLSDMALIKENHAEMAGGIGEAIVKVRKSIGPKGFIEAEVKNMRELEKALAAGADRIMLDNMTPAQTKKAVSKVAGRAQTESSGNITLENIKAYAQTGVDFISIGAITHSAPVADLSLLVEIKGKK